MARGRWNLFDATVVALAAFEEILKLFSEGSLSSNLTSLRLLRILKITRVIRIVRVIRMFRELRIMFMSIISTMRTLCWSIVCVLLIMSVVAAYIATAASDYVALEGGDPEVKKYFGSMMGTMMSLFQATTAGIDWRILSEVLGRTSKASQAMLLAYISIMVYAVMNILTGICVTTANKAADDDLDYTIHQERVKRHSIVTNLKRILDSDHEHHSGELQWSELQRHLDDPLVRGYFKCLDLEPYHLQTLFDLLTHDSDNATINIDQFIRGCVRLRCNVKNIDMMAALSDLEGRSDRGFGEIIKVLDKLERSGEICNVLDELERSGCNITCRGSSWISL